MAPGEDARLREGFEPEEGHRAIPLGMALLTIAVALWGGTYFLTEIGSASPREGDRRTPSALAAAAAPSGPADGATVYANRCQICHQADGLGVAGSFPPLGGSEWVVGDPRRPILIASYGLTGSIEVAGTAWASTMPAQQVSDEELAAVLTYVRSSFGNSAEAVTVEQVAEVREDFGPRGAIGGQEELTSIFP